MSIDPVPYGGDRVQSVNKYGRLLGDRILVQKLAPRRKKGSIIVAPDSYEKEQSTEFHVFACGPGLRTPDGKLIEMTVAPGDDVVVGRYSGHPIVLEDIPYYVIRESEVLMVLPK